jgi:hypothetical protein
MPRAGTLPQLAAAAALRLAFSIVVHVMVATVRGSRHPRGMPMATCIIASSEQACIVERCQLTMNSVMHC